MKIKKKYFWRYSKRKKMGQVVFLIDASSAMAPYWREMTTLYLSPIIAQLNGFTSYSKKFLWIWKILISLRSWKIKFILFCCFFSFRNIKSKNFGKVKFWPISEPRKTDDRNKWENVVYSGHVWWWCNPAMVKCSASTFNHSRILSMIKNIRPGGGGLSQKRMVDALSGFWGFKIFLFFFFGNFLSL